MNRNYINIKEVRNSRQKQSKSLEVGKVGVIIQKKKTLSRKEVLTYNAGKRNY
jgi:hypothetical protein